MERCEHCGEQTFYGHKCKIKDRDSNSPLSGLSPCPFCGEEAEIRIVDGWPTVFCKGVGCYANRRCIGTIKQAKAKWNERAR